MQGATGQDIMQRADAYARKLVGTKSGLGDTPLTPADRGVVLALVEQIEAQNRRIATVTARLGRLESGSPSRLDAE